MLTDLNQQLYMSRNIVSMWESSLEVGLATNARATEILDKNLCGVGGRVLFGDRFGTPVITISGIFNVDTDPHNRY
jgi:hypothetical protein